MNTIYTISLLLSGLALIMVSYIIFKVIKNEKRRKEYSTNMKVGDHVYIPIVGNGVSGDISKVDGDDIYVTIKMKKERIYPN